MRLPPIAIGGTGGGLKKFFLQGQQEKAQARSLEELVQTCHLTRREEEILRLVFQDWSNEEILDKLVISRHTLLKHLQNLYRKCGVSSRWDLRKLGP